MPHLTHAPLEIRSLTKRFGQATALAQLDVSVQQGHVLALLGPSGCGKTTLLRCIAGLLPVDGGDILIQGECVASQAHSLPPEQRRLGMVFQDYALWPHMTVAENLDFPLAMQGLGKAERRQRIHWALEMVGLAAMATRQPGTLSGGQQQRIALARAIVARPRLLLMDEPLSNLDKGLREQLALEIRSLIDELGLTAVFVTHDQHEAYALADRVAVMQDGRIAQLATPEQLFRAPASADIARFLDAGTLLSAQLDRHVLHLGGSHAITLRTPPAYQGPLDVLLPRCAVRIDEHGSLCGQVRGRVFQGEHYTIQVALDHGPVLNLQSPHCPPVHTPVRLTVQPGELHGWLPDGRPQALQVGATPPPPRAATPFSAVTEMQ